MYILVYGANEADHLQKSEEVLQRLKSHGIQAKKKKCYFIQDAVEYLGHRVDAGEFMHYLIRSKQWKRPIH